MERRPAISLVPRRALLEEITARWASSPLDIGGVVDNSEARSAGRFWPIPEVGRTRGSPLNALAGELRLPDPYLPFQAEQPGTAASKVLGARPSRQK